MNVDDDDPWLDEDVTAPAILERNAAQDWERLSNKFTDVRWGKVSTLGQLQRQADAIHVFPGWVS